MDLVRRCNVTMEDKDTHVVISVNDYAVFIISSDGTFSRPGCIDGETGLDLDELGRIKETK